MRIAIDLQGAQGDSRHRGIGRYSLNLALAIARNRGDHEVVVALNGVYPETIEPIRAAFDGTLLQDNIRVWHAPEPPSHGNAYDRGRRRTAELLREAFLASLEPDLVHVMSLFEGFHGKSVTSIGRLPGRVPTTATLYDLIPHVHREIYLADRRYRRWYYENLLHLRRASLLLSISEASRQEAIAQLSLRPSDIVTVSCGADARFRRLDPDPVADARMLARHGITRPFVMYTGGDDHRKNLDALVRAYAQLPVTVRRAHQLVIVCSLSPSTRDKLTSLATARDLSPDEIVMTGQVPDDDLVRLYNACTLFVFPSWHEGFGLPVLEAMCCGAPVIGSNATSVPEVIGRDDALFDAGSDASIAEKLLQALTDHGFRADLVRHGLERAKAFSWDASAQRAISTFEGLHADRCAVPHPPAHARSRPRLAYVSPLPPDRSGIADYSAELLPELSRHYDIDAIVPDERTVRHVPRPGIALRTPNWLRANSDRFDRVLYHFGNSPLHDHMFDLLADVPGVVVLHDFFLSGVLAHMEGKHRNARVLTRALYESHGYGAVLERSRKKGSPDIVFKYPANLPVLQHARGMIVHSDFARRLAGEWYGDRIARDWSLIPHLRMPRNESDRSQARAALGLDGDSCLVCCFGMLGPTRLNHRVLDTWLASSLSQDRRCRLVFVGANDTTSYGASIIQAIAASGVRDRVRITGWVAPSEFRRYLAAADIGVQLRAYSRDETSGTVLDCMNHGVPTIVNACGAMAELPSDAVWMLPETFDDAALAAALDALGRDPGRRAALAARAREFVGAHHDPRVCADLYAEAIEGFYARPGIPVPALVDAIYAQDQRPERAEWPRLAEAIARNHPVAPSAPRLFVDISDLVQYELDTGVQRVTRNILSALLAEPPARFRVEPVYAADEGSGFRYARHYTLRTNDCPADWSQDDPIDPGTGDIFLGLDLNRAPITANAGTLEEYRADGLRVYHVVYDLLPILHPEFFPVGISDLHTRWLETVTRFDGVVAISRAVAHQLLDWLDIRRPERHRPLGIGWWHLGSDIEASRFTRGLPPDAAKIVHTLRSTPSFLIVGTIEPRKGHAQALSAFEDLWAAGADVNLVIAGKKGWKVDDLAARIRGHRELGQRLFWLEGPSDEYLQEVYAAATCLIAPSEAEGFGLPLVEAARHELPILARDIQIFREVAGTHAMYFTGRAPKDLTAAVQDWLTLFRANRHVRSKAMPWLTWQQSARNLIDVVARDQWALWWPPRPGSGP